jgi:hypothetical protein
MSETNKKTFAGLDELALRTIQPPDDMAEAPEHEFFIDDNQRIRNEKCNKCETVYAIGYSRIYRTKRTFADLCDQLQQRLEEDHAGGYKHRSLILLRWHDSTRKSDRD